MRAPDPSRDGAGVDKSSCRQYRSPDSSSDVSFYSLGTKIRGGETPNVNRSTNDKMILGQCGSEVKMDIPQCTWSCLVS